MASADTSFVDCCTNLAPVPSPHLPNNHRLFMAHYRAKVANATLIRSLASLQSWHDNCLSRAGMAFSSRAEDFQKRCGNSHRAIRDIPSTCCSPTKHHNSRSCEACVPRKDAGQHNTMKSLNENPRASISHLQSSIVGGRSQRYPRCDDGDEACILQ